MAKIMVELAYFFFKFNYFAKRHFQLFEIACVCLCFNKAVDGSSINVFTCKIKTLSDR